jgi:Leucine-rich repeat (LRR) protein
MGRLLTHLQKSLSARRDGEKTAKKDAALDSQPLEPQDFVDLMFHQFGLSKQTTTLDLSGTPNLTSRNLRALLQGLPLLRKLTCRGLSLSRVPDAILQLTALQELDLSHNPIATLPPQLKKLSALRYLDVSHCALTALPAELGNLQDLRYLNAASNSLTSLFKEIGYLGQLRVLRLSINQLQSLPHGLGALSSLEVLHLALNQLQSLPEQMQGLSALRILNVSGNALVQLPLSLAHCPSLRAVNATANPLQPLPPQLRSLQIAWRIDGPAPASAAANLAPSATEAQEDTELTVEEQTPLPRRVLPPPLPLCRSQNKAQIFETAQDGQSTNVVPVPEPGWDSSED